ncbi:LIC_13387 family protein [Streptomyces griseus]|uniref:LIC_13387 family protein n=1 Tax=Streptomyces griseus TaxID=1911 RepID=UPI00379BDE68
MGVRHAVVAGGGIGGLTAAVALSRRGWRVTVCERASALTGTGAGIVLAPNALRALESIGLGPAVSAGEPLAGVLGLRTPDGAWLSRTGATASRYGLPARAVHRGFLIDTLAAALPPGALRLGVSVGGVDEAAEGAVVVRTSAGEQRADALDVTHGMSIAMALFAIACGLLMLAAVRHAPDLVRRRTAFGRVSLVASLAAFGLALLLLPAPPIVILPVTSCAFALSLRRGAAA